MKERGGSGPGRPGGGRPGGGRPGGGRPSGRPGDRPGARPGGPARPSGFGRSDRPGGDRPRRERPPPAVEILGERAGSLALVATCALGLESLLAGELTALGFGTGLAVDTGAVAFRGSWQDVWRANLWLRTANRVLVALARWAASDDVALAGGAQALIGHPRAAWDGIDVATLLAPERSFAIRATSRHSVLADVRWVALRTKDGLVDGQRDRFGSRSWVERGDPDLGLRIFLDHDRATLLVDTSGTSLDHRGYRAVEESRSESGGRPPRGSAVTARTSEGGSAPRERLEVHSLDGPLGRGRRDAIARNPVVAPVREQLAAACVLAGLDGWQRPAGALVVVDPMCGSGTLLAEAGWIALGWSPGRLRTRWAFERLPNFQPAAFARLAGEARTAERRPTPAALRMVGNDLDAPAVGVARSCLARAGLSAVTELGSGDAFTQTPPAGPGLLLVNPPYGERLTADPELWPRLGRLLRERYGGWRVVVLAGDVDQGAGIGLPAARSLAVRNGPLAAKILVIDVPLRGAPVGAGA